jgi:hypothetical protein
MFGGSKSVPPPPPPPPPPAMPSELDSGVLRKREAERRRMAAAVGRSGTILTRGLFEQDEFKTILG